MRILCVGDQHFRYELPYASAIADGRKGEWETVKQKILDTAKDVDAIVLMGDNFNSRHNHSSVIHEFIQFLKGFGDRPVHILTGNHERYGEHTALDFLHKLGMPSWRIYTRIEQHVQLGDGVTATFIPYQTPAMLGAQTKEAAEDLLRHTLKPDTLSFSHHGIMGAKATNFFDREIVLDRDKMDELFSVSFAGHLHQSEKIGNHIQMTGSIFTQEIGETGKSIYVWDSISRKTEEIPLPVRGIYKVDWSENPAEIFGGIPVNSIVKCYVTVRGTDIELVKETLKRFDSGIIIEQYPNERTKVHFEDGGLDLSVEGLLKLYSGARGLNYEDVKAGFELIK